MQLKTELSLALATLALAASTPSLALQKCISPSGAVTYSEQLCPGTSKSQSVGNDAAIPNLQVKYYDVGGTDLPALPGGPHGTTVWHVSYTYTTRGQSNGCVIDTVTTKLDASMTLPNWTGASRAPAGAQARWSRYIAALRTHEVGHAQIGQRLAEAVKKSLPGTHAASCGALAGESQQRFNSLLEDFRRIERDYDAQTQGGATQGARFQ